MRHALILKCLMYVQLSTQDFIVNEKYILAQNRAQMPTLFFLLGDTLVLLFSEFFKNY